MKLEIITLSFILTTKLLFSNHFNMAHICRIQTIIEIISKKWVLQIFKSLTL